MEDIDIYADLPSIHIEENEDDNETKNNIVKLEEEKHNIEKELNDLRTRLSKLEGINNKLESNFSSLIKTAKAEITRKDRTINDLRTQLDNLMFRRNRSNQNRMPKLNQPPPSLNIPAFNGNIEYQGTNYHQHRYPPPPIGRKIIGDQEHYSVISNHPLSYPPPTNPVFNNATEQYQDININDVAHEEVVKEEYVAPKTKFSINDNESDEDDVVNKVEYRSTVYGERLRKKLLEEMENEKKKKASELKSLEELENEKKSKENELKMLDQVENEKKEEELKISEEKENERIKKEEEINEENVIVDQLNNKENLSLANKTACKIDNDYPIPTKGFGPPLMDSDYPIPRGFGPPLIDNDYPIPTRGFGTTCNEYKKGFSERDKYSSFNSSGFPKNNLYNSCGFPKSNQHYSNNHNNKNQYSNFQTHRNYRNQEYHNHYNTNRYNGLPHTESNHRHSRRDNYEDQSKKHDRHKSSQRSKSRHRERSNSNHRSPDSLEKKRKHKESKHGHTPKKHKKNKEGRKKTDSAEKKKKHKDKVKTPKRKRSRSKERSSHKSKRRKEDSDDCPDVIKSNEISAKEMKTYTSEQTEIVHDEEKNRMKDINEEKSKLEYKARLNKINTNSIILEPKEIIEERDRKTIEDRYNKFVNRKENPSNIQTNETRIDDTEICGFTKSIQEKKIKTFNENLEKISKSADFINSNKINEKVTKNIESLNNLEEGEIQDSMPQNEGMANKKESTKTEINVKTVVKKEPKLQERKETNDESINYKLKDSELYKAITGKVNNIKKDDSINKINNKVDNSNKFDAISQGDVSNKVNTINKVDTIDKVNIINKVNAINQDYTSNKVHTINKVDNISQDDTSNKVITIKKVDTINKVNNVNNITTVKKVDTIDKVSNINEVEAVSKVDNINKAKTINKVNTNNKVDTISKVDTINKVDTSKKIGTIKKANRSTEKVSHKGNSSSRKIEPKNQEKKKNEKVSHKGNSSSRKIEPKNQEKKKNESSILSQLGAKNDEKCSSVDENVKQNTVKEVALDPQPVEQLNKNENVERTISRKVIKSVREPVNPVSLNKKNIENTIKSTKEKDNEPEIKQDKVVTKICAEKIQKTADITSKKKENKQVNSNDILNKQLYTPKVESEMLEKKKKLLMSKLRASKNVIIVKRRRRPVQLSDSPPVVVITNPDLNKYK